MIPAIDLFAGPGGWDCAAKALGLDPLGVEWDDAACATREAAGLRTIQASVADLDPLDHGPADLLIASPPCPTFSSAGKGDGIADMPLVYEAAIAAARGKPVPELPWRDERSALVVEPLRWAVLLEPRFLAWEQVPPVLPFWEHCANLLRERGWNVWTGIMEAERYGVPQTRERAILMADREGPVHPPLPTHQRYVKGEPQRHETTLEGEILPWVSMAEALGWGMSERPSVTVASGGKRFGAKPLGGGSGSQATIDAERDRGAWVEGVEPAPAPTVSGGGTSGGGGIEVFAGTHARDRAARAAEWVYDRRSQQGPRDNRVPVPPVPTTEPAPTPTAAGLSTGRDVWTTERPSTAVCGDPRISPPGYRGRADDYDAEGNYNGERSMDKAIRVTLEEAAILQSFPPDYPFQGTKSQRFLQVGNAVPPLLAHAILSALLAPVIAHLTTEAAA